jgi:hypothetical protein
MNKQNKSWSEMSTKELREATREFEREDLSPPKPLTKADRQLLRQAREHARRGRPVVGRGAAKISATIEKELLGEADRYAHRHGLSRSQLIAEGLKAVLRKAG